MKILIILFKRKQELCNSALLFMNRLFEQYYFSQVIICIHSND